MMPGIFVLAAKATQYNVYALPWSSEPHLFDQGTSPSCPPRSISSYIPLSHGDLCHILLILQAPPHSCPYILHFLIFKLKKKLDCDDQISPVLNNLLICIARQLITTSCPITTYITTSSILEHISSVHSFHFPQQIQREKGTANAQSIYNAYAEH